MATLTPQQAMISRQRLTPIQCQHLLLMIHKMEEQMMTMMCRLPSTMIRSKMTTRTLLLLMMTQQLMAIQMLTVMATIKTLTILMILLMSLIMRMAIRMTNRRS